MKLLLRGCFTGFLLDSSGLGCAAKAALRAVLGFFEFGVSGV